MKNAFHWRVVILAMGFETITGSASRTLAQADPPPQAAPDLASRIYSWKKQLAELRSQVEARKTAPAVSAPTAAVLPSAAPAGKGLPVDVGKFVTNAGAEVIETKDNWNYSRSLLFSCAIPYFHFGVRAKYTFDSKASLSGFLLNGWNNSVDNNSGKTTGFTLALNPPKKLGLIENYYVGPEQANDNSDFRHLTDTVLTYNPNAKLSLMANYDYGHDRVLSPSPGLPAATAPVWWSGFSGYIKYAPNAKWAVATRGEWFKDHNGVSTGTAQNLGEFTLTLERLLASKIISRLEFRRDMSDQAVFPYRTGLFKDAQNTVTVGMVYAFSSADAK